MLKYSALLAAGALSLTMSAQAATTVFLDGFTFEPRGSVVNPFTDIPANFITTIAVSGAAPVPPAAGTYLGGGQMSGLLDGNSFLAYCVQISVPVLFGVTYSDYVQLAGPAGFGSRSAALASLVTWASTAGSPSNAAQSAAMQAAVWEVVHETTDGAFSFTSGKLQTTSTNAATQAALDNIQTNWSTIMTTVPLYDVYRLDGAAQDMLIFAPIPEASTLAMMALGLAGVGVAARQRRQS